MNKKINGYTLNELVIVLALTVIIVGIAFSVLKLVNLQLLSIKKSYEKNSEFLHFQQQLKNDMDSANKMYFNYGEDQLSIHKEDRIINYFLISNRISREDEMISLEFEKWTFFNNGKEVVMGNADAVQFTTKSNNMELFFFINQAAIQYLQE